MCLLAGKEEELGGGEEGKACGGGCILKDPQCVKCTPRRTLGRKKKKVWQGLPPGESKAGEQCCETQPTPRVLSAVVHIHQHCAVLIGTSKPYKHHRDPQGRPHQIKTGPLVQINYLWGHLYANLVLNVDYLTADIKMKETDKFRNCDPNP